MMKVRKYGQYIHEWDVKLAPKATAHRKKNGDYDYILLIDSQLPEIIEKTQELYNYMKENDRIYKFDRSSEAPHIIENWYEETFGV